MKKAMIGIALATALTTGIYAGGSRDTVVTVEGKLSVTNSVPSIVSGDKTWVLPVEAFYQIAWENGLKVGDSVKAEGRVLDREIPAAPAPTPAPPSSVSSAPTIPTIPSAPAPVASNTVMFMPSRVWVNGKEIDLSKVIAGNRMGKRDRAEMGPDNDMMPKESIGTDKKGAKQGNRVSK